MTEAEMKSRMETLMNMLQSRTDNEGNPKPGYKSNVARVRAEIAILQEQINGVKNNGN